ncbi:phosphoribosylformimino-5-aminoimidazole carboxamide ribotide isomerase [Trinickia symbiotica]|uniref:Phosphoribosylformimino-5-aminoimidazole carboxamide ribotide isomerase n=1 Tax=Trinickia symbiotica TaxID=863227 RepID=A0A2T3Y005_9BURK|nr:HisA/HisF-related TIM barrel protein [Trinickia symbiotica]PTB22100.1 phosphoribosylformimino-5-aminoimidazole carboxamide ribotide isomerase [Trinickia symbiotica]
MQVIPVLDLLDGHAVRAQRGERATYRPIRSPLARTSEPVSLARALVAAIGATTLYIADLDAILAHGRGDHAAHIAALRSMLPDIEIWLDAGFADYAAMRALFDRIERIDSADSRTASRDRSPLAPLVPIFGTESLRDPDALRAAETDGFAPILSLDHRAGRLIGDAALDRSSAWWPSRVIAMTLDQVGSYEGPDLATFTRIRERAPLGTTVIGAGGIRDQADLEAAAAAGATGWLIASALHDGHLAHKFHAMRPSGEG